jgi:SAM-dependent methyltransferase
MLACILVLASGCVASNNESTTKGDMFSEAEAYERFMGRWSQRLTPLLVKFAGVQDGDAVLDVGSGTGVLALHIAAAAPSSRITGVDPSAGYINFAQKRAPTNRVNFEVGDAQQLRFSDSTFDRTLALLVMNFIPDRTKALREMIRVTRPGGVVAAAVWDYGEGMEMLRIFWDEAVARDPAIASRDERHMPLSRKGQLEAFWRENGLLGLEEQPLTVQLDFSSFDDFWTPFPAGQGPAGAHVASISAEQRSELQSRLRRRLLGDGPDRPITLQARAWAVKGVVPPR